MNLQFTATRRVATSGVVSMSAMQGTTVTPANSLTIVDNHEDYRWNLNDSVYLASATGVPIVGYPDSDGPRDYQLCVTDKALYTEDSTRTTTLLPYEYQPRYDHYEYSGNPSGTISICYRNGDVVDGAKYRVEYGVTPMWEDYRDNGSGMSQRYDRGLTWSAISPGSGVQRFRLLLADAMCYTDQTYYIRYNKAISSDGATLDTDDVTENHTEVINPEPIYKYGLDYSYNMGERKVEVIGGGLLPLSGVHLQRPHINRIRVDIPRAHGREGWYPRIWGGSFIDSTSRVYYVPELTTHQPAAVNLASGNVVLEPRCGFVSYDTAYVEDPIHVRTREYPLYITTTDYPTYIPHSIYDGYHNPLDDYDTNPDSSKGINLYVNGSITSSGLIVDWDAWNGILELGSPLMLGDEARVSHLYRQLYYTLQVPDVNSQVHHMKPGPPGCTASGYVGVDDSIVVAILPSGAEFYSGQSVVWYHKSSNPSGIYDGTYCGYSTVMSGEFLATPDVPLVVGTIDVAELSASTWSPTDAWNIYDTRIRGGGIVEDPQFPITRREDITRVEIQEESNYYSDIGLYDGQGLKKDGILIVRIPIAKLNTIRDAVIADGYNISENDAHTQAIAEVRRVIEDNIGLGAYYVIVDERNIPWPSVLPGRR